MFTKTRFALAVFALAGLVGFQAPAQAQDKLLPNDAQMVMSFNLQNLMGSKAFNKHFKEMLEKNLRDNAQAQKVLTAINMDPMRDLHAITMAFSNVKVEQGSRPDMQIFVVVKGKFDTQKIETALSLFAADNKNKVSVSQMGSRKVFEIQGDDRTMFAAFVDGTTGIVADSKERLQAGLDRSEGKSSGGAMDKDFARVLSRVDTAKPMWMAMVLPPSLRDQAKNAPQGEVVEKIAGVVIGMNVTDGMTFDLNVYTTDKDAAVQIKDLFQMGKESLGPLTLQIPDNDLGTELADVISKMKISQNDTTASMSLEISGSTLDKIVKFAKDRRGGGN